MRRIGIDPDADRCALVGLDAKTDEVIKTAVRQIDRESKTRNVEGGVAVSVIDEIGDRLVVGISVEGRETHTRIVNVYEIDASSAASRDYNRARATNCAGS